MTKKSKEEFYSLVEDITNNKNFNKLNKELHHGITRYEHSMRVAKHTYIIGKALNMKNLNETTRAALLHDFYINDDLKGQSSAKKLGTHPEVALHNSLKYYDLNEMQQDIIKSHMFPCNLTGTCIFSKVSRLTIVTTSFSKSRFPISILTGYPLTSASANLNPGDFKESSTL